MNQSFLSLPVRIQSFLKRLRLSQGLSEKGMNALIEAILVFGDILDISEEVYQEVSREVQELDSNGWWEFANADLTISYHALPEASRTIKMLYCCLEQADLGALRRDYNCYLAAILKMIRLEIARKAMKSATC